MRITVNGQQVEAADPERNLLDFLREERDLTGTKNGCGIGVCGTCTILVDNVATKARRRAQFFFCSSSGCRSFYRFLFMFFLLASGTILFRKKLDLVGLKWVNKIAGILIIISGFIVIGSLL